MKYISLYLFKLFVNCFCLFFFESLEPLLHPQIKYKQSIRKNSQLSLNQLNFVFYEKICLRNSIDVEPLTSYYLFILFIDEMINTIKKSHNYEILNSNTRNDIQLNNIDIFNIVKT